VFWALSGGRIPLALSVLQILCLDVGTDQLPALALGTEPPAQHVLQQPPESRHLIDARLLRRVFGVLGPAEPAVEMLAFFATWLALGWRPGSPIGDGSALLAASGAAFAAVVIGQAANAFACRSATRRPGGAGLDRQPAAAGRRGGRAGAAGRLPVHRTAGDVARAGAAHPRRLVGGGSRRAGRARGRRAA
jgi:hypothetical protein